MRWIAFGIGMLFLLSCGAARQATRLNMHEQVLQRATSLDFSGEQKLDTLATSLVDMMDEALKILNPGKGVKYIEKYQRLNEGNIDLLINQVDDWQKSMSTGEKIGFGIRMVQKPYARDLIDLLPKFERKYKQVKFAAGLSKKIKSGLIDAGLKGLGI